MRLIDADKLELDAGWDEYYDDFMSYSQLQIREAEEIKAIRLDKVKGARDKMAENFDECCASDDGTTFNAFNSGIKLCLEILDELLESEE